MPFELKLTIYIVAAIFVGGALLLWFFYRPINKLRRRNSPVAFFYEKVSTVVNYGDFYLLNNVSLDLDTGEKAIIDHIIGGDKYIYVILDRYFEGTVKGNASDHYWVYYMESLFGKRKKKEIPNPIKRVENLIDIIALQNIIQKDMFIGIVLVNDDCFISNYENKSERIKLIPVSKLEKVINAYEKEDVDPFSEKKLETLIQRIHDESEKSKNGK